jgi:hypothetical protein
MLPIRPGLPEKATHDYVRHGTTNLFAALEVASEEATVNCYDRDTQANETFIGGWNERSKPFVRTKTPMKSSPKNTVEVLQA